MSNSSTFFCKILFLVACMIAGSIGSYAEETGILQGRILDGETGEVMRSATITLSGTKKGALSDVKGSYAIKGIPSGTYTLRVTYVGYIAGVIENVQIQAGQVTKKDVVLQPESRKMEEIVVEARRSNDNQAAILTQRKNAAQVSDGISQEEIRRLSDADAGQALRRVSGVTLVNNKFIYVRGVSERYSNTTLNGAALTSTEPDKKSFAFDMFPSDLLENATIAKSFTPDLPGNFAGGLVQLNTIDFPEGFSLRFNASSTVNNNVTFQDRKFVTYPGGSEDWLGVDDGTRGMPAGLPATRRDMDALLSRVKDPFDSTGAREEWERIGKSFNSSVWKRDSTTALPNGSFNLSFSDVFSLADNDFGIVSSLLYNNDYSIVNGGRKGILSNRDIKFDLQGTQSTHSINWGGIVNLAYKLGSSSSISLKNLYNNSSDDEVTILEGEDLGRSVDIKPLLISQFVQKKMYTGQLTGEHSLPLWNTLFNWRLGYSTSERNEPDYRHLSYARQKTDSTQPFAAEIVNQPGGNGGYAGRFFSNLSDKAISGALDFTIPVDQAKIKFGTLIEQHKRTFSARSFSIIQSSAIVHNVDQDTLLDLTKDPVQVLDTARFSVAGLGMVEETRLVDSYNAEEKLTAAYLMTDFPFQISELNFRFIGGLRAEGDIQKLNSFDVRDQPVVVDQDLVDFLPSLNLIFRANTATNVRLSATQTLTRPSLREFAPFAFYDYQSQSRVKGNPDLKRTLIQNYDFRFETFPDIGEVFSAGLFYKVFENAIEETISPTSGEIERTFDNAKGRAVTYGIELEARKSLSFIDEYLRSLTLNINYALIRSEVTVTQAGTTDTRPMWGQSPYTLNIGLNFTEPSWKTSFTMGYNIYGRRIIQVAQQGVYQFSDPHIYELPRAVIDLSVVQPLSDAFDMKFVVRDLLNRPLEWEQGGVIVASSTRGRGYSFSIGYRLK